MNGILRNAITAVPLKFLSKFWIFLINCKVELTFKWTKYCVLPATGVDNIDDNIMIMVMVTILFFL